MACDKPGDGDCTTVNNCSGCTDCSGGDAPTPVLPKCQDVQLTPGSYTNATVVVNAAGCISAVSSGVPEQYTPDECCPGGGGGGSGGTGPRGPKGDPGAAATVDVQTTISQSGTQWTVENVGTSSAAVFKFTAPASSGTSSPTSGATGNVSGLDVVNGLVKQLPANLVTDVVIVEAGVHADKFEFVEVATVVPGEQKISLNLDALVSKIDTKDAALQAEIDALENVVAQQNNEIVNLKNEVDSLELRVLALETVGINSDMAWNNTSSAVAMTVRNSSGDTVSTVGVPANGAAELPVTNGEIYYVYSGTRMVGAYSNC